MAKDEIFYKLLGYTMAYAMVHKPNERQRLAYLKGKEEYQASLEAKLNKGLRK